jgi:DNA-binding NarL/FixJ family response regulator
VTAPRSRRTQPQECPAGRAVQSPALSSGVLLAARPIWPSGHSVFSDDVWRLLAGSLQLSQRESQIVEAIFDDQKESEIAVKLGISSHTVHTHVERLYRKLGVTSRSTLVLRVFVEYLWRQEGRRGA